MALIDIEVEEYLDEVRTVYLFKELKKREDFKDYIKEYITETTPDKIPIPEFYSSDEMLQYIKALLHLRPWHDKNRIIQEITSL